MFAPPTDAVELQKVLTGCVDHTSILAKCLLGENELSLTLQDAIRSGLLDADHPLTLAEVDTEIIAAITTLELTLQK